jgi:hypothetical protein
MKCFQLFTKQCFNLTDIKIKLRRKLYKNYSDYKLSVVEKYIFFIEENLQIDYRKKFLELYIFFVRIFPKLYREKYLI